jgi:hypothetical protein
MKNLKFLNIKNNYFLEIKYLTLKMKKLFSFIVFTSITLIALLSMTLNGSFYSAKEHMMNVKHKTVELAQRDSLYADCFEFKSNWNNGYGNYLFLY